MLSTIVIVCLLCIIGALAFTTLRYRSDSLRRRDFLTRALTLNSDLAADAGQKGHDLHIARLQLRQVLSDQVTLELENAELRETVANMGLSIELLADELDATRIAYAKRELGGTVLELDCI